jgi:hypothetical protein
VYITTVNEDIRENVVKLWIGIPGNGPSIRISDKPPERLKQSPTASQTAPKRYYVYGHYDKHGVPFYIGKGTDRRALEDERHPLWHRYVDKHLHGEYSVVILVDDLTSSQAEEIESEWIAQESETLVNWFNFGRKTDFAASDKYHELRDANRQLASAAREQERSNPDEAIRMYFQALGNIDAYATIQPELGFIGRLIDEEREEKGINGELLILDRLTLCLIRAARGAEAAVVTKQYFAKYRADESRSAAERIKKRVGKGARN